MMTICLDESGNFEDRQMKKVFVGGVVYVGRDDAAEKQRLERFFEQECRALQLEYPMDIHTTDMRDIQSRRNKEILQQRLISYLKASGSYHFTYVVKSNRPRSDYQNLSNIVNDHFASNLYEHMVCQLLHHLLFYTPHLEEESQVNLEIATRVVNVAVDDVTTRREYEGLGYQSRTLPQQGRILYYLTDQRTFKAAIGTKMMEARIQRPIAFERVHVESVNYRETEKTTPFLYLADFACDLIKGTLDETKPDFGIQESCQQLKGITGREAFCWAYDDIDSCFITLLTQLRHGDLVGSLDTVYTIQTHHSPYASHYRGFWTASLEKTLSALFSTEQLDIYISQMEFMLTKGEQGYGKALFLAQKIWALLQNHLQRDHGRVYRHLFRLADLLMRIYNHFGDYAAASAFCTLCEEYRDSVEITEYLATLNRMVQIDANLFRFRDGLQRLDEARLYADILKETRQEIAAALTGNRTGGVPVQLELRGKTLSAQGQFYAFLGEKEQALACFQESLEEFENPSPNRMITLSYLLHLALDQRDRALYAHYSGEYFQAEDLQEQFQRILSPMGVHSRNNFLLFVFIKALYVFYLKSLSQDFLQKILTTDYAALGFHTDQHPWELIYRYLAMISLEHGRDRQGQRLALLAMRCIPQPGFTVRMMNSMTEMITLQYQGDHKALSKSLAAFRRQLEQHPDALSYFEDALQQPDPSRIIEALKMKFRYMYG